MGNQTSGLNAKRIVASNVVVLVAIVFMAALFAIVGEWRMRAFVDYPWESERQEVLQSIRDVDQRVQRFETLVQQHIEEVNPDVQEIP